VLSFYDSEKIEVGLDEAGRGCLAGPVVAAAVILPKDFHHPKLNDSKKVSASDREELRRYIEKVAIDFSVGIKDHAYIDQYNILKSSFHAMHDALDQMKTKYDIILVDGNKFIPYGNTPHHCMIKGDGRFLAIAAASILAKTYRDEIMDQLHDQFPQYQWKKNKGYPTLQHRAAIREHGPSPYHRLSFTLLKEPSQGTLFT